MSCDYVADYLEEYIEDFLMREFRDREMLEKKLKCLDEIIEKQGSSTDGGRTWSEHYGYEDNLIRRLDVMEQLGCSEEEIHEYCRKHWRFSAIRKLEIQENLDRGNLDEAIRILRESKELTAIIRAWLPAIASNWSPFMKSRQIRKLTKRNSCTMF